MIGVGDEPLTFPRQLGTYAGSCTLLIIGLSQVYDVSKFLKEHPGGASIVIPSVPQPAPLFLCRTNPEKGRYGQAFRPYLSFPTRCCSWTPLLDYMTCTHLRKLAGKSSFPDEFGMSRYLGSDIGEVFEDEDHHVHSDAAHAMMDRYRYNTHAHARAGCNRREQHRT